MGIFAKKKRAFAASSDAALDLAARLR